MIKSPLVSVVMAAYNAEKYIASAIESILRQTYQNWELIILNDGSGDKTRDVVQAFHDSRILFFENDRNRGLVYTRNRMLELSRGDYIAVLDSDDIAYPDRLEKEVRFLNNHPAYGLVGSSIEMIDANGKLTGETWDLPAKSKDIPTMLFFHNNFAHSTVMYRRSVLPTPAYREGFAPAEDYDLWVRLSQICCVHNFKEPLVAYRVHGTNTSFSNMDKLHAAELKIIRENAERLINSEIEAEHGRILYEIFFHKVQPTLSDSDFRTAVALFEQMSTCFPGRAKNLRRLSFNLILLTYFLGILNLHKYPTRQKFTWILSVRIGTLPDRILFLFKILAKKLASFLRWKI